MVIARIVSSFSSMMLHSSKNRVTGVLATDSILWCFWSSGGNVIGLRGINRAIGSSSLVSSVYLAFW